TGLAWGKTPREVEDGLERITPAEYKHGAHHWLILHGRYVCMARKPDCPVCVVADLCRYGAKTAPAEMAAELIRARTDTGPSAMSISRLFCKLASTLPSTSSLSQEVISPDSEISRPTIRLRLSPSLRRGLPDAAPTGIATGSAGRRIGSAWRGASPAGRGGSG